MTQTTAVFYDAYRSLNDKKMFWIVLAISGVLVGSFAALGINQQGLKVLVWQFDIEWLNTKIIPAPTFYKGLFVSLGIGFWLSWIATILALISTAGIFPDLVNGGSIGLLVSKPISRLRLFLTQYLAGLLFVALQVTVFCLASFLVIGLRGGAWEPGLFMAVPLVVCFFSYLFAVCVFWGLVTRSTLAALLLTLIFWFGIWAIGATESWLVFMNYERESRQNRPMARAPFEPPRPVIRDNTYRPNRPPRVVRHSAVVTPRADQKADGARVPKAMARAVLKSLAAEPEPEQNMVASFPATSGSSHETIPDTVATNPTPVKKEGTDWFELAHRIFYSIKTVLPKTTETVGLIERTLTDMSDLPDGAFGQPPPQSRQAQAMVKTAETLRNRSVWWVVGTSLGFEFLVLAWAATIFCRRDF